MEHTYQYAWIIPFLPLPIPMLLGVGLLLFPTATKNLRRMWSFTSVLLLSIVMTFLVNPSIHQINSSSIYQYVWSWTISNDFSLEFGYLIDPLTSIMSILITTVGIMVYFCFKSLGLDITSMILNPFKMAATYLFFVIYFYQRIIRTVDSHPILFAFWL